MIRPFQLFWAFCYVLSTIALSSLSYAQSPEDPMLSEESAAEAIKDLGVAFELPEVITHRSLPQRLLEAGLPAAAETIATFIPYAMSLDQQASQKTDFGFKALSRGFAAFSMANFPTQFILMGTAQSLFDENSSELEKLGVGLTAGAASALYAAPLELILVQQRYIKGTRMEAFRSLTKHRGWRGMTLGLFSTMLRDGGITITLFGLPSILGPMMPDLGNERVNDIATIVAGSALTTVMTHPLSTATSEIQRTIPKPGEQPLSIPQALRRLHERGGHKLIWEGIVPRFATLVISFVVLDMAADHLSEKHNRENAEMAGLNYDRLIRQQDYGIESPPLPQDPFNQPTQPLWRQIRDSSFAQASTATISNRTPLWRRIKEQNL